MVVGSIWSLIIETFFKICILSQLRKLFKLIKNILRFKNCHEFNICQVYNRTDEICGHSEMGRGIAGSVEERESYWHMQQYIKWSLVLPLVPYDECICL